jgi:hypothetical protein
MTDNEKAFLKGLTALSKKHGVVIWGCGCCGSPLIEEADTSDPFGKYLAEDDGTNVTWTDANGDFCP